MRHMVICLFTCAELLLILYYFIRYKGEGNMLEGIHETLIDLDRRIEHFGVCL